MTLVKTQLEVPQKASLNKSIIFTKSKSENHLILNLVNLLFRSSMMDKSLYCLFVLLVFVGLVGLVFVGLLQQHMVLV
jgi:hypothetical protein